MLFNGGVDMKILNTTALILIVIGGINWGLVGFFNYNLVDAIFSQGSFLARAIYAIVGIAALWTVLMMGSKSTEKD